MLSGDNGGIENVSTAGLCEDRERKAQLQDFQEGGLNESDRFVQRFGRGFRGLPESWIGGHEVRE